MMILSPLSLQVLRYRARIHQALRLEFKTRQVAMFHADNVEAQAFMRSGQVLCQPVLEPRPFSLEPGLNFQLDIDLVGEVILAPDVDLEFVNGRVLAHNGLYCTRVN